MAVNSSRRSVALVTGAKRGIGRGIAVSLAERGFDIVLNDLEHDQVANETLEHLQSLGARVAFIAADISKLEAHAGMVEAAFAAFGTLDCLVNNAGVSVAQRGDLLEVTAESFDRVVSPDCRGDGKRRQNDDEGFDGARTGSRDAKRIQVAGQFEYQLWVTPHSRQDDFGRRSTQRF